jgi:hypothetical protein
MGIGPRTLLISLFLLLSFSPTRAQGPAAERSILLVAEIEDRSFQVAPDLLDSLYTILTSKMVQGGFQVVPLSRIQEQLRAQKLESYKACYDDACQIELGRALAAQKVVTTQLMRVGEVCYLSSTLFDLKRETAEDAAVVQGACTEEALLALVSRVATDLGDKDRSSAREAEQRVSEFDSVLSEIQARLTRRDKLQRSWSIISVAALDRRIPERDRIRMLEAFVREFSEENPHLGEAMRLLSVINPGTLVVDSIPHGAQVLLGATVLGNTPLNKKLVGGQYELTLFKEGYLKEQRAAKVELGKETRVAVELRDVLGVVQFETQPPGASVQQRWGKTKTAPCQWRLKPGTYSFFVSAPGHNEATRHVIVKSAEVKRLVVELEPIPVSKLTIETRPPGAQVAINKKPVGVAPLVHEVAAGAVVVEATLAGYEPGQSSLSIEQGDSRTVVLELERKYPMNPYKKWGYATLAGGLGGAVLGIVAYKEAADAAAADRAGDASQRDASRTWAGVMYTGFGLSTALLTTSIVLFALSPGDRAWFERRNLSLGFTPGEDSLAFGLAGSW